MEDLVEWSGIWLFLKYCYANIATPDGWKAKLRVFQDGLPVCRQSPIQVLTGPGVEQQIWPCARLDSLVIVVVDVRAAVRDGGWAGERPEPVVSRPPRWRQFNAVLYSPPVITQLHIHLPDLIRPNSNCFDLLWWICCTTCCKYVHKSQKVYSKCRPQRNRLKGYCRLPIALSDNPSQSYGLSVACHMRSSFTTTAR